MSDSSAARREVEDLLETMLAADGYRAVVRRWPEHGPGHAQVEIIASPEACDDCLVQKEILALVLADKLPPGVRVDEADLVYPSDAR
jgi:hypothetical protein